MPDPASRFQPRDVHGPSEVVDPAAFDWHDDGWRGRPWHEAVLYELHVGTFTPDGTYAAAAARLDYLADLGVTAVELMPLAEFPGRAQLGLRRRAAVRARARLRAARGPEGLVAGRARPRPHGLRRRRLQSLRSGGELSPPLRAAVLHRASRTRRGARPSTSTARTVARCATSSSTTRSTGSRSSTSTGCASTPCMRSHDDSRPDILTELRGGRAAAQRRTATCISCSRTTTTRRAISSVMPPAGRWRTTAQWNDDVHHVLHVLTTGETRGLLRRLCRRAARTARPHARRGLRLPGRALAASRRGGAASRALTCRRPPSSPSSRTTIRSAIAPSASGSVPLAPAEALRAAVAIVLLSPSIPLLFMGEEWNAPRAVPLLLRLRAGAGRCGARRPAARVRSLPGVRRRGRTSPHSGSARARDVREREARLVAALPARARRVARAPSFAAGDSPA